MKKKIVVAFILLVGIIGGLRLYHFLRIKWAKIEVTLKDDLTVNFNDVVKVSDYIVSINGKIIDDYTIDTTTIGKKDIAFEFVNDDGIKVNYSYTLSIIDNVEPIIWLSGSYRVKKGSDNSFINKILCGDNYDSHPNCFIEGDYDLNKIGDYDLVFKAIDQSGNTATKNFVLKVYEPSSQNGSKSSKKQALNFTEVVKKYKTVDTRLGIDVSSWQNDIDFASVKKAGVEFVIIRVGGMRGTNGEYYLDKNFVKNIESAQANGLDVGLYFYSYADNEKQAVADAKWLIEQIKGYNIDLPIAFDWEDWVGFNEYQLSFFELSKMAEAFLDTVSKAGYQGMLYSSKNYLEQIWFPTNYDVWLAHYTDETDYKGKYRFWQISSSGKVDGISTLVDIDVMYLKKDS